MSRTAPKAQESRETAGDAGDDLPIAGMKLKPAYWPHMSGAYMGLVQCLIGKPEAREAFKTETGVDVTRALGFGVSLIERMVDSSSGYDRAVVAAFADWVTEFHWGSDADPESYEDEPAVAQERRHERPPAAKAPSGA